VRERGDREREEREREGERERERERRERGDRERERKRESIGLLRVFLYCFLTHNRVFFYIRSNITYRKDILFLY
jgi:hypothetical protein